MDLFKKIKLEKKISATSLHLFKEKYGNLFFKSLEFLQKEGPKVKKITFLPSHLEIWSVQGAKRNYIIYPDVYCQCHDFLLNSIYRKQNFNMCKHLMAQKLAEALDQYVELTVSDKNFTNWKKQF